MNANRTYCLIITSHDVRRLRYRENVNLHCTEPLERDEIEIIGSKTMLKKPTKTMNEKTK